MQQLQSEDAAYVFFESDAIPLHIDVVHIFDADTMPNVASTADLRGWISSRAESIPELQRKLVRVPLSLGYPYWLEQTRFDAERHLWFHDATGAGEESLQEHLAMITEDRLDLDNQPWQIHVITGLRGVDGAANAIAVVLKIHHCLADGMMSLDIMGRLFQERQDNRSHSRGTFSHRENVRRSRFRLAAAAARQLPADIVRLAHGLRDVYKASKEVDQLVSKAIIELPKLRRVRTRFNNRARGTQTLGSAVFTVLEVQEAKAKLPTATINDVMITIISRALELYLTENNEPLHSNLAALVPMSTRGIIEKHGANQFDALIIDLHNDENDLRERCDAIRAEVRNEKFRDLIPVVQRSRALIKYVPAPLLIATALINRRLPTTSADIPLSNTLITNVKSIDIEQQFYGAKILSAYFFAPLDFNTNLTHGICSAAGQLSVSFRAEQHALPNPERYRQLLRQSFDELVSALG